MLGIAATVVPIGAALAVAVARIRDRRTIRYLTLSSSLLLGALYVVLDSLSFTECFHFVEYGLLGWLFYRSVDASRAPRSSPLDQGLPPGSDGSVIVLPLLAGFIVGTVDEWFQWFIPIRAGEARDIVLDVVATVCGLLLALSVEPPHRLAIGLTKRSLRGVATCTGVAVIVFALFVISVHVGHDVRDPRIGTFRSRYTSSDLAELAQDRARRWAVEPPVALRRLSREDQYLSEGLWRVQQRNLAWEAGDLSAAWRENLILETFYAPILDTQTYAGPDRHRWPADQRADVEMRPGVDRAPFVSEAYRYPLLIWPEKS
jgi:hypothetical protein